MTERRLMSREETAANLEQSAREARERGDLREAQRLAELAEKLRQQRPGPR